ncbi:SDR family NAD(P)-dependent oxidoreductase [Maribellus maritimus]|uniref:SDR family NAD(P)-dependent oxidoreductase n=1 Tax=Maribellus maritimus TaxID=2870838 RepID=UPI0021D46E5D|nr:SDR family NAD(P)-dependent oxidoreductase [Maribellus maritimus]MCG6191296.1 SDR family NAD(P)-dependent oxidoreductase [Maribellus maritimus]
MFPKIDEGPPNLTNKIDYEISANLTAPVKLSRLLLPVLMKSKNNAIVNISSRLFIAPKKSASVYCETKSAIHSFTKTLRYQLENTGTKVFEIIPALVETPMTAGRGKSKISPEQLTDEFMRNFKADKFESYIGKTKLLKLLNRLSPKFTDKTMKNGI